MLSPRDGPHAVNILFQEQYMFVHEAILENILCGMNEVDSTKVQQEIESLAEIKASGMTGFEEKFKVVNSFYVLAIRFRSPQLSIFSSRSVGKNLNQINVLIFKTAFVANVLSCTILLKDKDISDRAKKQVQL
jgi:hypothetical protein